MAEEFEVDQEILVEFINETLEELDGLDSKYIALEKNPGDSEVLNSIFRTMHSIKGASAFFNLTHIRNFAHKLEFLLDDLRKGVRNVDEEIINILLKGKDVIEAMLNRLVSGDMSVDFSAEEESLYKKVEVILDTKPEQGVKPHQVFTELDKLRAEISHQGLADKPVIVTFLQLLDKLREAVMGPEEGPAAGSAPPLGKVLVGKGLVTENDVVEALSKQKKLGEILIEDGKVVPEEVEKAANEQALEAREIAEAKKKKAAEPPVISGLKKSMRVEEEKIDNFMDSVGELIINAEVFNYLQKKLESGRDFDKLAMEFKNANVDFSELIFNLQKGLAEVRKVSIKGIFQKLPRMVRDLASDIGKQVELTVTGDDLLIDKSLFEQLESPLNHLIRNAVDHGVEPPEIREAAGKPPAGQIEVNAEEVSGEFIIHITDDGKGMDAEKLKGNAVNKGLLSPDEAEAMPDKEAYKLIFMPGFSMAEKVTDVSGRGVGMDVVMTTLKENKGRIDITTELGQGTDFIISVPMSNTLITISGLVVAVGKENFIVPMEWVRESIHPSRDQVSSVKKQGEIVRIREQMYPLLKLYEIFGIEPNHAAPWDGVAMLIEKEGQQCCLLVDEIVEETQVVLKDLGEMFNYIPSILGGAILGDGNVGLVLNVEGIINANKDKFKKNMSESG